MQFRKTHWKLMALLIAGLGFVTLLCSRDAQPDDSFCERLLAEGKSAEARAWALQAKSTKELRTIHELDNAKSLAIIEKLYALGAELVTACDIETAAGVGETTNILIVTLPTAMDARKRLLRYERSHAGRFGFGGVKDAGQKYLFLWWS